jgi:RNA polymerase sigma-54 factor
MALTPRLDLRQSQQLVMTPQLQQAIKLLQLSNLELGDYVTGELEKNPLLEVGENTPAATREENDVGIESKDADYGGGKDGFEEKKVSTADELITNGADNNSTDAPLDTDFSDNVFNNDAVTDRVGASAAGDTGPGGEQLGYNGHGSVKGGGGSSGFDENNSLESRLQEEVTLKGTLEAQLQIVPMEPSDKIIATYLIEAINDAGYFVEDISYIQDQLGCDQAQIESVLTIVQGMEPAGVFARSLQECLTLQLKDLNRFDPCMEALLNNLDLVAAHEFNKLKKVCNVDTEDLGDMLQELKNLNPKPGLIFESGGPVQTVVADVFVRKNPAGIWTVELNSDTLPRVLVNSSYYAELTTIAGSKEDKAYLSDCYSTANWLVKALDQRARTILKVSSELVKQQQMFFELGVRHLKPLNLKAIAEAIEMHESTVSRVTANKFLSCPRGLLEMKYFFTSAIQSTDGGDTLSAVAVRDHIKELIDAENPKKILSDDKLVELLKFEGIDIARRTVAKYREAMGIASSVQRRRQKKTMF